MNTKSDGYIGENIFHSYIFVFIFSMCCMFDIYHNMCFLHAYVNNKNMIFMGSEDQQYARDHQAILK
jgi:hypothetical protein